MFSRSLQRKGQAEALELIGILIEAKVKRDQRGVGEMGRILIMVNDLQQLKQIGCAGRVFKNVNGIRLVHADLWLFLNTKPDVVALSSSRSNDISRLDGWISVD